ncbi:hypothetical protein PRIPAC_88629 [Pristionchus pacificus]|uniref:Uncharacterized protein n=1 Tax=Pristionchus pacificus TaxID=54126 RepID=A0A2A6B914_PRIPA|nr:hypothetical protein PRIPAC_88629 [Pristionchus pacificus]|eukprot:PDM62382.1 hypothetical protein PRIPAC_51824 [Pristionchus pacificus]
MVEIIPAIIIIIADAAMVVTLPVHVRFFYVLKAKKTKFDIDPTYRLLSLHLTGFNILVALIYLLELEPASHGAIPEFFQVCVLMTLMMTFHLLIALSRLTAIIKPTTGQLYWTWTRTTILCCGIWALVVVFSQPIIFTFDCVGYQVSESVFGTTNVIYTFVGSYNTVYPISAIAFESVLELLKSAMISSKAINTGIYRMTLAAFINSIGGWLICIFLVTYYVYLFATGNKLMSFHYYSVVLRFLVALNNVLTPWVMLASFEKLRHLFLGRLSKRSLSVTSHYTPPTNGEQRRKLTVPVYTPDQAERIQSARRI